MEQKFDPNRVDPAQLDCLRGALDEVECIAKGGMAHIFRARQPSLNRYIAIKKLKDELVGNQEMIERFRREARALASVLHQNIAHVYDFVEGARESYIVMEFIDGIDLSTLIEKAGPLPPQVAAAILLGVSRGVQTLHANHLIHRDIKPSNIRLTTRGTIKIMDFGIVMDEESHALTRPGMMVGSPSYLSPEQVLGDPITPRADLFLLGTVLYEMLTATRPFRDEGGETVFQRIREAKYVPLRSMRPSVPDELNRLVKCCLSKDPKARYATAQQVALELERYLGAETSIHTDDLLLKYLEDEALLTPSVTYQPIPKPPRAQGFWSRWPVWAQVGAAISIFVLGVGTGHFLLNSKTDTPTAYPPAKSMK